MALRRELIFKEFDETDIHSLKRYVHANTVNCGRCGQLLNANDNITAMPIFGMVGSEAKKFLFFHYGECPTPPSKLAPGMTYNVDENWD